MEKPLIIFHSSNGKEHCDDGFSAAWVMYRYFGYLADYVPGVHQQPPPNVDGRTVYIVDFSYKRPLMEQILDQAREVILLDHHVSAKEDLSSLESDKFEKVFNVNECGASLTWKYMYPQSPLPKFLEYIRDQDLFQHKLYQAKEFSLALRSYPKTFELWDEFFQDPYRLTQEGIHILRYYNQRINDMVNNAMYQSIGGYVVPVVNAPWFMASDLGHKLSEHNPFAAVYSITPKGYIYSLRSRGQVDVSKIAAEYGGGGHPNASGFTIHEPLDFVL